MLSFALFALAFCALYAAHFVFAWRSWRRVRGGQIPEIDQNYVRMENYFGQSFRRKVQEWMRLPEAGESTPYLRTIRKGNELILIFGGARAPSGAVAQEILVVDGDFSCGRDSRFAREILVKKDCEAGRGTRLQAIAVDGRLSLGARSHVSRWVDAVGPLDLGAGTVVGSRVYSAAAIHMQTAAEAPALCAPRIVVGEETAPVEMAARPAIDALSIPGGEDTDGFDSARLLRQSEDCWIYAGDLHPRSPVHVTAKLIVRGSCTIPAGSWIEDDLKADSSLEIGESSLCKGSLTANGRVVLGPNCVFRSVVYAGGPMRLCRGVRGHREGGLVVAYAAGRLTVESGVVVEGKLASGETVVAADSLAPEGAGNRARRAPSAWLVSAIEI